MRLLRKLTLTGLILPLVAFVFFLMLDSIYPAPVGQLDDHAAVVLDRHGDWLYAAPNSDGRWRFGTDTDMVDPSCIDILLFYEDKRFFSHPGADPIAMLRAAGQLVANGEVVSGASTLTMQVARMLERRPRTIKSKFIEIFRAFQLEWHYSKREILAFYLTLAPYGGNIEGIEAGARSWFGKSPSALTLAESALLAVLPQRPARLRPDRYPEAASTARDKVLLRLLNGGKISQQQFDEASAIQVPRKLHRFPRLAPHYSAALLQGSRNAVVQSSIDSRLQRQLESLAAKEGKDFEDGVTLAAVVLDNRDGKVRAWVGSHDLYDEKASGYVDMVRAVRSPGSTLKPFIFGLAFDSKQLHPKTLIRDLPRSFGSYSPTNFDGSYRGDVSVIEALQQSLNIPAVAVLERIRPGRLADAFHKAGVELRVAGNRPALPMALGGVGMTLEELAGLYRNLAVSSDTGFRDSTRLPLLLDAESAGWITRILAQNTRPAGLVSGSWPVAWKTGTSYGYRDAWTLGYNSDVTVGVWIGRPDGHPRQGSREMMQGRRAAAPIFFEIMGMLPKSRFRLAEIYGEPPPSLTRFEQEEALVSQPLELRLLSGGEYVRAGAACQNTVLDIAATHGVKPFQWFINGTPAGKTQSARHRVVIEEPGNLDLQVMDGRMRTASLSVWLDQVRCL